MRTDELEDAGHRDSKTPIRLRNGVKEKKGGKKQADVLIVHAEHSKGAVVVLVVVSWHDNENEHRNGTCSESNTGTCRQKATTMV